MDHGVAQAATRAVDVRWPVEARRLCWAAAPGGALSLPESRSRLHRCARSIAAASSSEAAASSASWAWSGVERGAVSGERGLKGHRARLTSAAAAPRRTAPGARRPVCVWRSRGGGARYWVRRARSRKREPQRGRRLVHPGQNHRRPTHLSSEAAFERLHLLDVLVLQVRQRCRELLVHVAQLRGNRRCGRLGLGQPELHAPHLLAQGLHGRGVANLAAVGQRGVPQRRALGVQRWGRRSGGVAAHGGHRRPGRPNWRFAPPVQRGRHGPPRAGGAAQLRSSRAHRIQRAVGLRRGRRPARAWTDTRVHAVSVSSHCLRRLWRWVGPSPGLFARAPFLLLPARRPRASRPACAPSKRGARTFYETRKRGVHKRRVTSPSLDSLALSVQHAEH